jgi:hypothetical protein
MSCPVQVYDKKLAELRAKGDPIKLRFDEAETRDSALQSLSNACQHNLAWCKTDDPKYAHIDAKERETVANESRATLQWLEDVMRQQAPLSKTDPPAVLTKGITDRQRVLHNVCSVIINKPVPPPPKPEPAVDGKKAADGGKEGSQHSTAEGVPPDAGASPMETDTAAAAPADSVPAANNADAMDQS